jgi:hypothetical protein
MFVRFITWWLLSFLSKVDLLKLVSKRLMTPGRDRIVMQDLYTIHDEEREGKIDYISFNALCLDSLLKQFGIKHLSGIIYLETIRLNAICCADPSCDGLLPLFESIEVAVAEKNYLKRLTNVKKILREALFDLPEADIALLAHAAIEADYAPNVAMTFIKNL